MAPPSAALEHGTFDVVGGVKPFSSGASDIDIPHALMVACFVAFITYNIASFFDIDLPAIINFGTAIYQTLIDWINIIHQHIPNVQLPVGIQRTLFTMANFGTRIYNSSRNWLTSTYRSNMTIHAFRTGLKYMISNPREHLGRTILVDTVTVPGAGSLALIRGLPSDVSAPELRRFLESVLFIQYSPQVNASLTLIMNNNATNCNTNRTRHRNVEDTIDRSVPDNTVDAPIDTSTPGLWKGTCVRSNEDNVSTPSTSGINTPTSETSAVDNSTSRAPTTATTCALDSSALDGLAPASSPQRRSHARRA